MLWAVGSRTHYAGANTAQPSPVSPGVSSVGECSLCVNGVNVCLISSRVSNGLKPTWSGPDSDGALKYKDLATVTGVLKCSLHA